MDLVIIIIALLFVFAFIGLVSGLWADVWKMILEKKEDFHK